MVQPVAGASDGGHADLDVQFEALRDGLGHDAFPPGALHRKRRFWLAVVVINDSEEAAIFVRDVSVYGASSWEGTPLRPDEPDVRLEARERLVKSLDVDD